ncbi:MAG: hypothetical protein CM15mV5_0010 [uncultured marine virus]|nr:MAG: hypothetical protein CM15mV5_0010 [uncultured marine virus]
MTNHFSQEFLDVMQGGDIRNQFQILPFKEPSQTLYSLLGFVVKRTTFCANNRDGCWQDMQNGQLEAQSPIERVQRVMSAIKKRCYYPMGKEFRLLSKIFSLHYHLLPIFSFFGADRIVKNLRF